MRISKVVEINYILIISQYLKTDISLKIDSRYVLYTKNGKYINVLILLIIISISKAYLNIFNKSFKKHCKQNIKIYIAIYKLVNG